MSNLLIEDNAPVMSIFVAPPQPADPFGGMADFDIHPRDHELALQRAGRAEFQATMFAYESVLRYLDQMLRMGKKPKAAELKRKIELARAEIDRVSWRWL